MLALCRHIGSSYTAHAWVWYNSSITVSWSGLVGVTGISVSCRAGQEDVEGFEKLETQLETISSPTTLEKVRTIY